VQSGAPSPENLPALQFEHAAAPVISATLPGSQSTQMEAPDTEVFPTSQSEQEKDFATLENFPSTQAVQLLTPPDEKFPGEQSVHAVEPDKLEDLVPLPHVEHVDCAAAEVKVPPGQAAQVGELLEE
jgi:hypothetical protein